jgi:hypothetical protein
VRLRSHEGGRVVWDGPELIPDPSIAGTHWHAMMRKLSG